MLSLIVKSWVVVDWSENGVAQSSGPVVALFGGNSEKSKADANGVHSDMILFK
jgi:hypothetical protein